MAAKIRFAEPHDAPAVHAIYAPFCQSTVVSFETTAPTIEQVSDRIAKISAQYPWLVCERDGEVVGYVYACQHRERAAYRWAVDVTVYIAPAHHGRGIGRGMYTTLLELIRRQGYFNAYAGITLPNPGSVGLHEAVGFKRAVIYRGIGYKFGAWRDVGWWELSLQPLVADPPEPTPIGEIRDSAAVAAAIVAGERLFRD
jgi:L-amino acid N-acyltransferase YncA